MQTLGSWLVVAAVLLVPVGERGGRAERPEVAGGQAADRTVGQVLDREGVVTVRSAFARAGRGTRARALEAGLLLEPGDRIEVGTRGASAARLRLAGGAELVLGPGTLIELESAQRVALHRGDLACEPPADRAGGEPFLTVVDAGPAAAGGGEAVELARRAVLRGGKGGLERLDADPRWLEGYASDTVTEAVGALLARVDGRDVPLTIGYHKVTVDVRDQLARTVIEQSFVNHTGTTLEGVFYFPLPADASISGFGMWIGGELVQGDIVEKQRAREIYETILREKRDPGLLEWTGGNLFKARVFPIGAEKRIRISYTQVLPREGDGYRYRYALESEHLRLHPLERLELEVRLHSARPLASVGSPSHGGTAQVETHSARYAFSAEEYTPEGDFELRVELEPAAGEQLTLIPHRRGDDGYFMLLVDAPEVITGATDEREQPLDLLVLADTSGSMWGPQRDAQLAFVEALLGSLGAQDRFDLATCDVETRWVSGTPLPGADESSRERALRFLEEREPLGWSDLEAAFAQAFERAGEHTQVVYVGDAVPTAGAADPVALARALERAWPGRGRFHVVVPGSSSEPLLARAIAGLGDGTLRRLGAGADPLQSADALLAELVAPALEGLALEFPGLPVAAVHPARLPNLPAGGQQVVVGRFDATRGDLEGSVVLTGSVGGRALRRELAVRLAPEPGADEAGEEGNSFVPRLWARRHLDHLLEQGSAPEVVERIQRLSADYQIVTPYTSFLVLESDADRERFGVQKDFRMRDGEEFFLAGREAASHELASAAMRASAGWRRRLRLEALERLEGMGRELTALLEPGVPIDHRRLASLGYLGEKEGALDASESVRLEAGQPVDELEPSLDLDQQASEEDALADAPEPQLADEAHAKSSARRERAAAGGDDFFLGKGMAAPASPGAYWPQPPRDPWSRIFPALPSAEARPLPEWPDDVLAAVRALDRRPGLAEQGARLVLRAWITSAEDPAALPAADEQVSVHELVAGPSGWWVAGPRRGTHAFQVQWLDRTAGEDEPARRGVLLEGWRLGRERAAEDPDALDFQLPLRWLLDDSARQLRRYEARLEPGVEGRARLVLSLEGDTDQRLVVELDTERGLVLEERWEERGETRQRWVHGDFFEAGGRWWPGRVEWTSSTGSPSQVTELSVAPLEAAAVAARLAAERALREGPGGALLLREALLPHEARRIAAADEAGAGERVDARMTLLERALERNDGYELERQLAALELLVGDRPGFERVRLTVLDQSRRRERLRLGGLELARSLAAAARPGELGMALDLMQAAGSFGAHESLELLRALLPVIERAEAAASGGARATWDRAFLQALERTGRWGEYRVAARLAAERHPTDASFQQLQADALARAGDVDAALAWLDAVLEREGGEALELHGRRNLVRAVLDLCWNAYRPEELVRRFELRDARDREAGEDWLLDAQACGRLLAALVVLDRADEARASVEAWAAAARVPEGERTPAERERLRAAVDFLLGRARDLSGGALDLDRRERLAALALELAALEDGDVLLQQVLGDWRFARTDRGRAVLRELAARLERDLERLAPEHVALVAGLLSGQDELLSEDERESLAARLLDRWRATEPSERRPLGNALWALAGRELRRTWLREDLAAAERREDRHERAQRLWGELVSGPWAPSVQDELFELLGVLDASAANRRERDAVVVRLVGLVDWSLAAGAAERLERHPERDTLTRRELAAAARAARLAAGEELSAELAARAVEPPAAELADWLVLERLWLDFTDGRAQPGDGRAALELAARRAGALLDGPLPARSLRPDPLHARVLTTRALLTAALAVTRAPGAGDGSELERDLRALLERLAPAGPVLPDARGIERDLLLALGRGDELERLLAAWFGAGEDFAALRFGIDRAVLLAERGRLEEAVELLERVRAFDEVPFEQQLLLADWYTALDRREAALAARLAAHAEQGEDELAGKLWYELERYRRTGDGVPEELGEDVPLRLSALMRKASWPSNRLHLLRSYYEATKDFRLLESLPEAVLGHSAQGVYGFLEELGALTATIDEEAVVDRVEARLAELEAQAPSPVDRRALALLRFQVLRHAARQTHGTERHAERCLAALRSALPAEPGLEEGEPALMARFLSRQGRVEPESLERELLRQLRVLAAAAGDPDDRLAAGRALAVALWNHGHRDEAARTLESALAARREAAGGTLPADAHDALAELSGWLVEQGSHAAAEALWAAEAERAQTEELRLALELGRLRVVAGHAAADPDPARYLRARDELLAALAPRTDPRHAGRLVRLLCDVWDATEGRRGLERGRADARAFAFAPPVRAGAPAGETLPSVLRRYRYRDGQDAVGRMTSTLERLEGPTLALQFLLARGEAEPDWLALAGQDFWAVHGWQLARLARRSETLGPDTSLTRRLLALTTAELKRDLLLQEARARALYDRRHSEFWSERRDDFLAAAMEVAAGPRGFGEAPLALVHAADYLFHGLGARDEAIGILASAHGRGALDRAGRATYARYLQEDRRWAASLPVLEALNGEVPADAELWGLRLRALHHTRPDELAPVLTRAEEALRAAQAWNEWTVAALATALHECGRSEEVVRLLDVAIAMRRREGAQADGRLAQLYVQRAQALSRLGRTWEAVDSASGAILAWGPERHQRGEALDTLEHVLTEARDLDGFRARFEAEVEASGLENPILRKALAAALARRGDHAGAALQLELALQVQPGDLEAHQALAQAYRAQGREDLLARSLLERARAAGHDLATWRELAELLAPRDPAAAERAGTTLVELSPDESEGHAALAELRERQEDPGAALVQWDHVVRIRTGEPQGYLGRARALIALGRDGEAREELDRLRARPWPAHHGDVRGQVERLERTLARDG